MMRSFGGLSRRLCAVGLTAALTLSLTACAGRTAETADELSTQTQGVAVQISNVRAESIATDNKVSGRVAAEEEATIMVGLSAKCVATYVEAGDTVNKGDILCRLDLGSTLSQYSAAQISYDSAVQSYDDNITLFEQQMVVAQESVSVAQGQIAVTQEQIAATEQQIAASEQALLVSEEQIAASEKTIAASEEQLAASRETISASEEQIAASEEQVTASETQIPVLEESIALIEEQLSIMEPQISLAEKNVSDTRELLSIGAASQMELDNAQIQYDQALFGRDQLSAQLTQTRAQLTQARAQLTASKAQINQSKAQLNQSRAQLTATQAQIDQSKAQLNQSRAQLDTTRAQINASKAQLSQARFQLSQLELQRDQAQVQVTQLQGTRNSTLAQLEAGIENARSGVQQLDNVLSDVDADGNVIAPISGILTTFSAVANSYIANTMPLAVIQSETGRKIVTSVSEALVPKLSPGDPADVYISSVNRSFTARIRAVERAANVQTRLYTVTLTIPDDVDISGTLDMSADVTFHTDQVENAIVIPSEAILTSGNAQYVYIADGEIARYIEVNTGMTGSGVTEIVSGLSGGERLIVVGQSYVHDGDFIRVVGGTA